MTREDQSSHQGLIQYPISIAILATAIYSLLTIALYTISMWIPGFMFPFAWVFGCIVCGPFFIYLINVTHRPAALLPVMIAGLGMTISQSQSYALPGYLAFSQLLVLLFMTAVTQLVCVFFIRLNKERGIEKHLSIHPALLAVLLVPLAIAGYQLGTQLGIHSGQGLVSQLSEEKLLQQLSSTDMQRRYDAFNYLAMERPILLAEITMSDNPRMRETAIKFVQTHHVSLSIDELNRIVQENPDAIQVAKAVDALELIDPVSWYEYEKSP